MPEYRVILTWEAIYDMLDITEYIEEEFGEARAERFQMEIKEEIGKMSYSANTFPKTQIMYRNYLIHKKVYSPSIIFYILEEEKMEIHILRVIREEANWEKILCEKSKYTYPEE